jgi:hypothetical protein
MNFFVFFCICSIKFDHNGIKKKKFLLEKIFSDVAEHTYSMYCTSGKFQGRFGPWIPKWENVSYTLCIFMTTPGDLWYYMEKVWIRVGAPIVNLSYAELGTTPLSSEKSVAVDVFSNGSTFVCHFFLLKQLRGPTLIFKFQYSNSV